MKDETIKKKKQTMLWFKNISEAGNILSDSGIDIQMYMWKWKWLAHKGYHRRVIAFMGKIWTFISVITHFKRIYLFSVDLNATISYVEFFSDFFLIDTFIFNIIFHFRV